MTTNSTELAIIDQLNSNGMAKDNAAKLLEQYGVPWTTAGQLIEKGKAITVTSEDDDAGMKLAKETRKALQQERLAIEKRHDALKADSLAYGKAVDLVQRVALEQIKPVEEHLKLQEKFAEVQQEKRRQETINRRTAELAKYVDDVSIYNYGDMGDDAFALLIDQVRNAKEIAEAKAAEEAAAIEKARIEKEEADRIAREKAEAELAAERAANQKKLARISELGNLGFSFLGNDGYKYDELFISEEFINSATDENWTSRMAKMSKTITERQAEAAAEAAAEADRVKKLEEQAAADRAAAEKAAAEKAAAEAAEAKRVADEKAMVEAKAAAPDKEKLLQFIDDIASNNVTASLTSEKGKKTGDRIVQHLAKSIEAYRKLINEEL